jgi:hypothetical protein
MKADNKWTKYYLYKDGKKIDTCTKNDLKWIS